jgi:hypothetical protein
MYEYGVMRYYDTSDYVSVEVPFLILTQVCPSAMTLHKAHGCGIAIDYRCVDDRKEVGKLRGDTGAIR